MSIKEMITKKENRKAELVQKSETCDSVAELRSIQQELESINNDLTELRSLNEQQSEKRGSNEGASETEAEARTAAVGKTDQPEQPEQRGAAPMFQPGSGFMPANQEHRSEYDGMMEKREAAGKELKENRSVNSPLAITGEVRSVATSSGTIVMPTVTSNTINSTFAVVSSVIDGVDSITLTGGESYRQPYVDTIVAGTYTKEGDAPADTDTKYAYADINKTKITAYSEVTEELLKLPNAPYADNVFQNVRTSMRMMLGKEIIVGAGGPNQIVGICTDKATAIDAGTDLPIATIDDATLDNIVFNYGGSEEVEGTAVLLLNKLDLLAFAKVRTQTKEKFYDIKSNGNSGTINGIPFIINSALPALSKADAGAYVMVYGNLKNYKLVEFSPTEIKRSTDYKFKEGMVANRGVAMVGGNVTHKNGFLRVKKATTV